MWLNRHRREAAKEFPDLPPTGLWPADLRGTGAFTRVLRRMREELAGLVSEVWMDKDDDVILPTDLGGQGKRCKSRLVLMHLPWETARGTEELQWRMATESTVKQKMPGFLKAFFLPSHFTAVMYECSWEDAVLRSRIPLR